MKNWSTSELPQSVYSFWDELSDSPLEESRRSLDLLFSRVAEWIGADNAFWFGTARVRDARNAKKDSLHGWRLRAAERWLPRTEECQDLVRKILAHMERDPGTSTREIIRQAGSFRSYRLRDGFIDFKEYRKTPHYEMYFKQAGVTDRIWCVFPVNRDTESLFCFDRINQRRHFTEAHEMLVAQALRGIKWYHRQLLLNHGLLVGDTALSPAHRRLLLQLLSGKSEKQIADVLGLRRATTHKYVTDVYRSFNVNSRVELMTLWSGGG